MHTHVERNLGALELGALAPAAGADIERSVLSALGPTRDPWRCHSIDDASLETASRMNPTPTGIPGHPLCRHIDDAALESGARVVAPTMPPARFCSHIDDASLEAALAAGPNTFPPACRRIEDAALEGLSMSPPQPQTRKWYPGYPGCV